MSEKLNIAMFFGGNSSEHDVSKRSARNIYDAMDKEKYNVTVFLISKDGIMINAADSKRVFDGEDEDTIVAEAKSKMDLKNPLAPIAVLGEMSEIDLFYPVVHGNLGEDGTLQALFRLLQKPYIGPGTAASAMSFDKDLTKRILNQAGIRNTKYVLLTRTRALLRNLVRKCYSLRPLSKDHQLVFHASRTPQNSKLVLRMLCNTTTRFWLKLR